MCSLCTASYLALHIENGPSGNPDDKPVLSISAAGQRIADVAWSTPAMSVTYGFRSSDSTSGAFERLTGDQITAAENALALWADVANIKLTRVGSGTEGEGAYTNDASILFSGSNGGIGYAWAYQPGSRAAGALAGDVFLNVSNDRFATIEDGGFANMAIMHEIGHALGLGHAGAYNGGLVSYAQSAEYYQDSRQYTIMSYFAASNTGANHEATYASTPLLHDIAALQLTYGVNWATRATDTVYGFNSTADREQFHITAADHRVVFAVWDGGGEDTFDFSGYHQDQVIDLRQGAFSDVGGLTGNVAVALGAVIENAIGGSGDDVIHGNSSDNIISGNEGNDVAYGYEGNDTFAYLSGLDSYDGGEGSDTLDFRGFGAGIWGSIAGGSVSTQSQTDRAIAGDTTLATFTNVENIIGTQFDDYLIGDDSANFFFYSGGQDTIVGGGGLDTIAFDFADEAVVVDLNDLIARSFSSAIWAMFTDIENIRGSRFNDILIGDAGSNVINGGEGDDWMAGGLGDDVYLVDSQFDVVVEYADQGFDTVITTLSTFDLMGSSIEAIRFVSAQSINVFGNEEANLIIANNQNDKLYGGGANDILVGNGGADLLDGGAGIDILDGGSGNDIYYVDDPDDIILEINGAGIDSVYSSTSYTLADYVERLYLTGDRNINGIGNDLDNVLNGRTSSGLNWLNGGKGNDTYYLDRADRVVEFANGGSDTVITEYSYVLTRNVENLRLSGTFNANGAGNSLNNRIYGNDGNNTLRGGLGNDYLVGGDGNDKFVFDTRPNRASNFDRIADFDARDDMILLSRSDFSGLGGYGKLSSSAFAYGTVAKDAFDRILYDRGTGNLYYDADGVGGHTPIAFAKLVGAPSISAADFQIIG